MSPSTSSVLAAVRRGATAGVEWSVWTTTARLVVTDPAVLEAARSLMTDRLSAVGQAASRFLPDSEVSRLARARSVEERTISPVLADLLAAALAAAESTDGAVDPTVGAVLAGLGYDRDLAEVSPATVAAAGRRPPGRRPTWRDVHLTDRRLTMPPGVLLDLGATAKARTADSCAVEIAERFGCGVLVSLGGDLRTAGAVPPGGWQVLVQDGNGEPASTIALHGPGAVASSSTLRRVWRSDSGQRHHIVDPRTGRSARPVWRTVSVVAGTCLLANTLSTASIVQGERAPELLSSAGVAARLVAADGTVHRLGGWPE
jgi:thiamine biosynthesis lipoprotein